MLPKVSIVTASTGRKELARCISSVKKQTYGNVQHLVFADGVDASIRVKNITNETNRRHGLNADVKVIDLPYQVGNDRWNGHRMYGAGCYLAEGEYIIFLDDDNYLDSDHIQNCFDTAQNGFQDGNKWSYSLRKIVSVNGDFLCNDDCESLGKWASVLDPRDFFIDVNCYFLPRKVAVAISPIWYCRFREPGQPEIDRKMCAALRQHFPTYDCSYKYSVNYAVASNASLSVKPDFFIDGNADMLRRYKGVLPWKK
jgi:glycosyltransferase involved in cell wall biosynthesis